MGRDRGRGSNLSVCLEGEGGSRGGGEGGEGGESVDPYNITRSALFPAPSVLIMGPTKGV